VISISNSQRRPVPQAGWVKTIYHGLPAQLLTPQPVKPNYLAFNEANSCHTDSR